MDIAFDDEDKMYVINTSNRVQIMDINSSFQHHIYMQMNNLYEKTLKISVLMETICM